MTGWRGVAENMMTGKGPFCECGGCDSTGRNGGPEVRLPRDAWSVAGHGDISALAVAPGHETAYETPEYALEHHHGWIAVREARLK